MKLEKYQLTCSIFSCGTVEWYRIRRISTDMGAISLLKGAQIEALGKQAVGTQGMIIRTVFVKPSECVASLHPPEVL